LHNEFACQYLALAIRFYYNPGKGDSVEKKHRKGGAAEQKSDLLAPCVTTAIRLVGEIQVTISPSSAQVVVGSRQQSSATVNGDISPTMNWSVAGSGCVAAACGVISPDGLYTAPSSIPEPATVMVRAIATTDPNETASAVVTIVQPNR
jgi:hypothetical protein